MSGFFSPHDGEFWEDEGETATDVIPGMQEQPTTTHTPGYRPRHRKKRLAWVPAVLVGVIAAAFVGGGGYLLGRSATPSGGNPIVATFTTTQTPRAIEVTTTRRGWRTQEVRVTATRTLAATPRPAVTVTQTPSPKPGPTVTKTVKVEVTVSVDPNADPELPVG